MTQAPDGPPRRVDWLLPTSYSLGMGGYVASLVLVPKIAHNLYNADLLITSLAFAAANISLLVFAFIFGRHADVHGRQRLIEFGLVLSGFAILAQVFIYDAWSLIAARTLVGITVAMFPAAMVSRAHQTGWRMGKFTSFGSLAWGIGAALTMVSGVVGESRVSLGPLSFVGYQVTFLLGAVICFVAYVLAIRLPPIEDKRIAVERLPLRLIRKNAHIYLPFLVRHTGANAVWVTWALYIVYLGGGRPDIDIFIGVTNLVNTVAQVAFAPIFDRAARPRRLIAGGMAFTALTFVVFVAFPDLYALIVAQLLLGFAWSMLYVGCIRELMDSNEEKATVSGLMSSTTNVAQVVGPLLGGIVGAWAIATYDGNLLIGYQSTMWLAAALAVCGFALHFAMAPKKAAKAGSGPDAGRSAENGTAGPPPGV